MCWLSQLYLHTLHQRENYTLTLLDGPLALLIPVPGCKMVGIMEHVACQQQVECSVMSAYHPQVLKGYLPGARHSSVFFGSACTQCKMRVCLYISAAGCILMFFQNSSGQLGHLVADWNPVLQGARVT